MLKRLYKLRDRQQILEEGFLGIFNAYHMEKERSSNFIEDFNDLVSKVFEEDEDEELFSNKTIRLVEEFSKEVNTIILKETKKDEKKYTSLNEKQFKTTVNVLKDKFTQLILQEGFSFDTGENFWAQPVEPVSYDPPVTTKPYQGKEIQDIKSELANMTDQEIETVSREGLNRIKYEIEHSFVKIMRVYGETVDMSFEDIEPKVEDCLLSRDIDRYDWQYYELYNRNKDFNIGNTTPFYTKEEREDYKKLVRSIRDCVRRLIQEHKNNPL